MKMWHKVSALAKMYGCNADLLVAYAMKNSAKYSVDDAKGGPEVFDWIVGKLIKDFEKDYPMFVKATGEPTPPGI